MGSGGSPSPPEQLTGRIAAAPNALLDEYVLGPQFVYEAAHLVPAYVAVERALAAEARRIGALPADQADAVDAALASIDPDDLQPHRGGNFSDMAFAIEQAVQQRLSVPAPLWHVDRSRNDLQATAQRWYGRERIRTTAGLLLRVAGGLLDRAGQHLDDPMPGQTHLQAAQVISPGFVLSAFAAELLDSQRRLRAAYREVDLCPLGAGAMAGSELPWDRSRLAAALGFSGPVPHALSAVASRGWVLAAAGALSDLGVVVSRFVTDLMAWSSGAYQWMSLPDELAGISSAMPQKKNFPVLERIRGRSGHLTAGYLDVAVGQRNTSYTNLVEVSKEASASLPQLWWNAESMLLLLDLVIRQLEFDTAAMRRACDDDFLGGFALANGLALQFGLPWRTAQVVAGKYIVACLESGQRGPDVELLRGLIHAHRDSGGGAAAEPSTADVLELLRQTRDTDAALAAKITAGGTSPASMWALLNELDRDRTEAVRWWDRAAPSAGGAR
ncbi:argininosuccinate lyase [Nakamurella aerolata]|uniref:argininosuccinate lyase n=1 Tax=Nakamurella aerolata TaxID=1656892 RepID=A0A849ACM1_9ACTN|nr:lyase family protein [Nakamurella aerolata]NNG37336.1 argininosuccinate lyase [Nakamurella aerolata]